MLERHRGKIVWICDGCAEDLPTDTRDFTEAKEQLDAEGWRARNMTHTPAGVWVHYCPNCQEREERKG